MPELVSMEEREKLTRMGSYVGILGNAFLAVFKLGIGFFTGSLAIIADGIDTTTDILTSFLTLIASKFSNKPADESHPFGHEKIETIVTKLMSLVIIFAGYKVFTSAVEKLVTKAMVKEAVFVLIISGISVVVKYSLFRYKMWIGNKINSPSFIADAKNMKNDVFSSLSIFVGIFVFVLTGIWWLDAALAIMVSGFIFKVGFEMFFESSNELMDGSKELGDIYKDIIKISEKYPKVSNPHKIRVRKAGFVYFLEMHAEVESDMTVKEAHELTEKLESDIKESDPYIKDILIHIEPIGNQQKEDFGFNKETIEKTFKEE